MRSNLLRATTSRGFAETSDGAFEFDASSAFSCRYEPEDGVLWTRMSPSGVPCFSLDLLRDMERASQIVESHFGSPRETESVSYIVLTSSISRVFNLGGDFGTFLEQIRTQDRIGLTEYAKSAINVVYRNYTCHNLRGVTTVALLEGDALGGGLECALSCDVIIAERHVRCGFPEILFDMFPGMGALSFLSRRCNRSVVQELTRSGRQFTADELQSMGVVDHVVDTGAGVGAVSSLAKRRRGQTNGHSAMNAVERMLRPVTLHELYEVVGMWVSSALGLSPRGQDWMRRVYLQQRRAFGLDPHLTDAVVRRITPGIG